MKTTDSDHVCHECPPGMVMEGVAFEQKTQPDGITTYWVATQPIGNLFGSEVEGECSGFGKTKESAMERLNESVAKLYESLWA